MDTTCVGGFPIPKEDGDGTERIGLLDQVRSG